MPTIGVSSSPCLPLSLSSIHRAHRGHAFGGIGVRENQLVVIVAWPVVGLTVTTRL